MNFFLRWVVRYWVGIKHDYFPMEINDTGESFHNSAHQICIDDFKGLKLDSRNLIKRKVEGLWD